MNLRFKNRIVLSFIIVIVTTSLFSTFVGIKLISKSTVPRIQNEVRVHLNTAQEIFLGTVTDISDVIRLTANRFFIKDSLATGDLSRTSQELQNVRRRENLDVLNLTDSTGKVLLRTRNPSQIGDSQASNEIVKMVLSSKQATASVVVLSEEDLLKEGQEFVVQARILPISGSGSGSPGRDAESSGMLIMAAAPILSDSGRILGLLYGGKLLNNNDAIVDKARDTIFRNEMYKGKDVGAVTIFQNDLRIATNLRTASGERATGTWVPPRVYKNVLLGGDIFNKVESAVNDWYITAYEPIKDTSGNTIGILGLGVLEGKFGDMERNAMWIFLGVSAGGVVLAVIISQLLANSIMKPISSLVVATHDLAEGNLEQEVRLTDAPREIRSLGDAFNFMVSSIKERDKKLKQRAQEEIMKSERLATLGQLAAGVAHEINNPLGAIVMYTHLALEDLEAEDVLRQNLQKVVAESTRCKDIVKGLLDFARQTEPKVEESDANDILERTLSLVGSQALFQNIRIVKQLCPSLPKAPMDGNQIQQVCTNIILNAAEAMEGEGQLTVATRKAADGNHIEIEFTDTGCGIAAEHLRQLFEPFFTTKQVGRGTGLGLAVSYGIVAKHRGAIDAKSEPGKGSTFTVRLPLKPERS
ncbi:MAG: cache domain-containing protein [Phycisphaerales bacterium]|nr:MAG: cache domain-containing protein [Phycisphaerales bacterium]